jgi:PAS domain S-box-containing protein
MEEAATHSFGDRRRGTDRRKQSRREGEQSNHELQEALTGAQIKERAVEEALHRSEAHFQLLVNSVVDYAIFTLDPEGFITTWNRGAQALKGYTAEEIIGKQHTVFYTVKQREEGLPEKLLERAREDGHVTDTGWRVRKDGSRFLGNVTITAMRNEDGELLGFAKVTRDMTQIARVDALAAQVEELVLVVRDLHGAVDESRQVALSRVALAQRQVRQRTLQLLVLLVSISLAFGGLTAVLRINSNHSRQRLAATVRDGCQHIETLQTSLVAILKQGLKADYAPVIGPELEKARRDQIEDGINRLSVKPCEGVDSLDKARQ